MHTAGSLTCLDCSVAKVPRRFGSDRSQFVELNATGQCTLLRDPVNRDDAQIGIEQCRRVLQQ
jgi:hypothetical protein